MRIKRLIRHINMLNMVFLTGALFFAFYIFFPALDITSGFTLPSVEKSAVEKEETGMEVPIPSITEYAKIPEENLFHPERKIPVEKKAGQQEPPLPKPEFILYGTLITDDLSLAYIEDLKAPRNSPGRGKRHTPLKKGDTMSGFTLKEIDTDKVVMVRGEEKMVVAMNDPAHPKDRKESAVTTASGAQPAKPQGKAPAAAHAQIQGQAVPAAQPTMSSQKTSGTASVSSGEGTQPTPRKGFGGLFNKIRNR